MSRIVMKFGGTSVGGVERIKHVADIVKSEFDLGNQVVVVLSAMSGETDKLINLTKDFQIIFLVQSMMLLYLVENKLVQVLCLDC